MKKIATQLRALKGCPANSSDLPWTTLAQPPPQGFLERCREIRWAVPTSTPNFLIARQDAPEARRVSNRFWLTNIDVRRRRSASGFP